MLPSFNQYIIHLLNVYAFPFDATAKSWYIAVNLWGSFRYVKKESSSLALSRLPSLMTNDVPDHGALISDLPLKKNFRKHPCKIWFVILLLPGAFIFLWYTSDATYYITNCKHLYSLYTLQEVHCNNSIAYWLTKV